MNDITFVLTCKGRLKFLQATLPSLVALPRSAVVLVDYDCPEKSGAWVETHFPSVRVVRVTDRPKWNGGESRNRGAALVETEWVCFTDADIHFHPTFMDTVMPQLRPGYYYQADADPRGLSGTILCRKSDYDTVGGFDELFSGWGYDDGDFLAMLEWIGIKKDRFAGHLVSHMHHPSSLRAQYMDDQDVIHSWTLNKIYSMTKTRMMRNVNGLLDVSMRRQLYDWAKQSGALAWEGQPATDLYVEFISDGLEERSKILLKMGVRFTIEKK